MGPSDIYRSRALFDSLIASAPTDLVPSTRQWRGTFMLTVLPLALTVWATLLTGVDLPPGITNHDLFSTDLERGGGHHCRERRY